MLRRDHNWSTLRRLTDPDHAQTKQHERQIGQNELKAVSVVIHLEDRQKWLLTLTYIEREPYGIYHNVIELLPRPRLIDYPDLAASRYSVE